MCLRLSLIVLLVIVALTCKCDAIEQNGVEANDECNDAMNDCLNNERCRGRLTKLRNLCKDLFSNFNYLSSESSKISCSSQCRHKLIRAKKGILKKLLTCKSEKSYFFPYQERATRCIEGKIDSKTHDNYVTDGCSTVFKKCMEHNRCRKRYERMMFECSDMINGKWCSTTCEKSLRKFLVSQHMSSFYQCSCDGAIYFQQTCHSLKQNIVNLCVSKNFKGFLDKRNVIAIK